MRRRDIVRGIKDPKAVNVGQRQPTMNCGQISVENIGRLNGRESAPSRFCYVLNLGAG